jgi:hypothetical protein
MDTINSGNTIDYRILHNLDARFSRPYQSGDRLADGYVGRHAANDLTAVCEEVFAIHNRDDRPDGKSAPSMSVGDVVIAGETAFSVDRFGFTTVTINTDDLLNTPWLQAR